MKLVSFFLSSLLTAAVLSSSVSADEVKKNCKVKNKHSPKHHQKHHHQKQHHKHHHHHHHKNNSTPSYSGNKNHNLTPGGCKAGVAGEQSVALLASGISWINNWQGTPFDKLPKDITFVSQCYGYGWSGHPEDWQRFEEFKKIQPGTVSNFIQRKGKSPFAYFTFSLFNSMVMSWQAMKSTLKDMLVLV